MKWPGRLEKTQIQQKSLKKLIGGFTPYLLNTVLLSISECVHANLPTPVFAKRTEHQLDIINIISDEIKDVLLIVKQ